MNRRSFIKKLSVGIGALFVAPKVLLWAKSKPIFDFKSPEAKETSKIWAKAFRLEAQGISGDSLMEGSEESLDLF